MNIYVHTYANSSYHVFRNIEINLSPMKLNKQWAESLHDLTFVSAVALSHTKSPAKFIERSYEDTRFSRPVSLYSR